MFPSPPGAGMSGRGNFLLQSAKREPCPGAGRVPLKQPCYCQRVFSLRGCRTAVVLRGPLVRLRNCLMNEPAGSGMPGRFPRNCYYKVRRSNRSSTSSHPKHYSLTHGWVVPRTAEPRSESLTLESDRFLNSTQVHAQEEVNNVIFIPSLLAEGSYFSRYN